MNSVLLKQLLLKVTECGDEVLLAFYVISWMRFDF